MKSRVSRKIFNAKILLFGEQIINKGATGLAIPFEHFHGTLKLGGRTDDEEITESHQSLQKFAKYIVHDDDLEKLYNTNQLLGDLEQGLYFESNIPEGFGLGSSGALVAAIYNQYRLNKKKQVQPAIIRKELAEMESYFHGKSSGLDALVCYLNKAVLIKNGEVSNAFDLAAGKGKPLKVFIINTRIARKTSHYVKLFMDKCADKKFMNTIEKSLIPVSNMAVESFIKGKHAQLMQSVKLISQLQYDLLPEFIPAKFKEVWQRGLKYNEFHLKICGAGGGGFLIGFAKSDTDLSALLDGMAVIEIMQI